MRKGRPIMVEGRLKLDQWDDKATGAKRSKLGVVAETVQFLGSAPGAEGGAPAAPRPARPAAAAPNAPAAEPVEGDGPPESDDVPF
jgi:single-strand DNA-binding protein